MAITASNCSICGALTQWNCSDCKIDTGKNVPVCGKKDCRDKHEMLFCTYKDQKNYVQLDMSQYVQPSRN